MADYTSSYTGAQIDAGIAKANTALQAVPDTYRTSAAQDIIDSSKQATLVSGTNIKTINNNSILGSGNITISGGGDDLGWTNKVVSILGDSISTFANYVPVSDGHNLTHRVRYNTTNAPWYFNEGGTVNDTYWMHLINTLGAKLGINDSWAGSRISNSSASDSGDVGPNACMASITRISNLGANGTPDLILYYGGTNDAGASVTVGTFDSTATYTLDTTTTTWSNFATAYKDSIMRLQYYYPNAKILVLLPMYCTTYYTMGNLDKYNEIIKEVCDYFGVEYIDFRRCGINQQNLSTMLGDGIHPKKAGFELMYRYLYNKLKSMYSNDGIENVVYTVTNSLSTNTNSDRYIKGVTSGKSYSATITGSALSTVYVTMGGTDITSSVYNSSTGVISISSVTGNIVISEGEIVTHTITTSVTNGSYTGSTSINEGSTATVTITANSGYKLPSSVSVIGATHSYNSSTGVISLSNATTDVTISATCDAIPVYNITTNVSNGTYTGATTIQENETATVTVSAGVGYILPDTITVSGATYTYTKSTGAIVLSNPTGAVTISVVCEEHQATVYNITTSITGGTYSGATQIQDDSSATVTVVADGGYNLPDSITVIGASHTYDKSTGLITLSSPTGDVTITVSCVQIVSYTITTNVTNGTYSGATTITNVETATVTVSANTGNILPETITVTNAQYTYSNTTGVITLSNATGNVVITVVCSEWVLPSEYTKLQYIDSNQDGSSSTGTHCGVLDTLYDYVSGDVWEVDAQMNNSSAVYVLLGRGNTRGGTWVGNNGGKWAVGGSGYQTTIASTTRATISATFLDDKITISVNDGTNTSTATRDVASGTGDTYGKYCFFTMVSGTSGTSYQYGSPAKLYSAKLTRDGSVVMDLIPAKNSSDVAGMYDKVSGTFFSSKTSIAFTAGPEAN